MREEQVQRMLVEKVMELKEMGLGSVPKGLILGLVLGLVLRLAPKVLRLELEPAQRLESLWRL